MTLNLDKIMEILVRNLEKVASDSIFALDIIPYRAYKAMYGEPPGSGTGYKEVYYFLAEFGEDTVLRRSRYRRTEARHIQVLQGHRERQPLTPNNILL